MTTMAQKRRRTGRPVGTTGIKPGQQALYGFILRLVELETMTHGCSEREACKRIMARMPGGIIKLHADGSSVVQKIVVGGIDGEGLRNIYRRAQRVRDESPPHSYLAQCWTPSRLPDAEQSALRHGIAAARARRSELEELKRSGRLSRATLQELLNTHFPI